MSGHTIETVDRFFHCPKARDILKVMEGLALVEKQLQQLEVQCISGKEKRCAGGLLNAHDVGGILELCPIKPDDVRFLLGNVLWAAALNAGFDNRCQFADCENDFTVPPEDMVTHASIYADFIKSLAGEPEIIPARTIPCKPRATGTYVSVPTGPAHNPRDIHPVDGRTEPLPGSTVLTVYKDEGNKQFIYKDDMMGARTYLPGEPKRYYLGIGNMGEP